MNISILRDKIKAKRYGWFLLKSLSFIYIFGFEVKKYFSRLFKKRYPTKIICVGNISSGGTGKTTLVIHLARNIVEKHGKKIAIVMKGYKGDFKKRKIVEVCYDRLNDFLKNPYVSDEQKTIVFSLKELKIPVIASKNRKKAIEFAIDKYHPDLIISDDGFQNFSIEYDFKIVVINPSQIDDDILPLGNLRERYSGIKRADLVIINHSDIYESKKIKSSISQYIQENKIITSSYKIDCFEDIINYKTIPSNFFNGKNVAVLCGIGDNEQFIRYLKRHKMNILKIWKFPDHHKYTIKELISIENLRENLPIITTLKDASRILHLIERIFKKEVYVARISMRFEKNIDEFIRIK